MWSCYVLSSIQLGVVTGYPGHEHQARAAIKQALGEEKYEFLLRQGESQRGVANPDEEIQFVEYFFGEDDAKYFASLGLNCIRSPVSCTVDIGDKRHVV